MIAAGQINTRAELKPILNAAAAYFSQTTFLHDQYFTILQALASHYNWSLLVFIIFLDELLIALKQFILRLFFTSSAALSVSHDTVVLLATGGGYLKTHRLSTFEGLLTLSLRKWEVDCLKFIESVIIMQTNTGCVQARVTDSKSFTEQFFGPAEATL